MKRKEFNLFPLWITVIKITQIEFNVFVFTIILFLAPVAPAQTEKKVIVKAIVKS